MKKLLAIIVLGLLWSGNVYAETILLKCKFIDGKVNIFENNKFLKAEKKNDPYPYKKEHEIQINPALKKIIKAPSYDIISLVRESWQDDYIMWRSDVNVVGAYDTQYIYDLNIVTGILSVSIKNLTRIVKDGHYQKDPLGGWIGNIRDHYEFSYQCKKEDRLF